MAKTMRRHGPALGLLAGAVALLGAGCDLIKVLKPTDLAFDVDKQEVHVGEELEVSFSILKRDGGRRYWVTLLPQSVPFDDPTGEVEVPEGARSVHVSATAPGPHSVRVLSDRGGSKRMVAWRKLSVLP